MSQRGCAAVANVCAAVYSSLLFFFSLSLPLSPFLLPTIIFAKKKLCTQKKWREKNSKKILDLRALYRFDLRSGRCSRRGKSGRRQPVVADGTVLTAASFCAPHYHRPSLSLSSLSGSAGCGCCCCCFGTSPATAFPPTGPIEDAMSERDSS